MNPQLIVLSDGNVIYKYEDKEWLGTFGTDGSIVWKKAGDK